MHLEGIKCIGSKFACERLDCKHSRLTCGTDINEICVVYSYSNSGIKQKETSFLAKKFALKAVKFVRPQFLVFIHHMLTLEE